MTDTAGASNRRIRVVLVVATAAVVALIVAIIVLAATREDRGGAGTRPGPSPSETAEEDPEASVCGLAGVETEGVLETGPEVEWLPQGPYLYPSSADAGPGETSPEGVRSCFQRTPEGALLAAAGGAMMMFDPVAYPAWAAYVLSEGEHRESLLASATAPEELADVAVSIVGFRLESYDGDRAHAVIALEGVSGGRTAWISLSFDLVWEAGDWRVDATLAEPVLLVQIPGLDDFVPWRAG